MLINTTTHHRLRLSGEMQSCRNYILALEEERRKIQVFRRELPLCLHLVTQAIESCRQQFSAEYNNNTTGAQSEEFSDQMSGDAPVFEEFIPIKRSASSHSDDDGDEDDDTDFSNKDGESDWNNDKNSKKSDWLRSVQLWNQTSDPSSKEGSPRRVAVMEVKRNAGGAFQPFKKDKSPAAFEAVTPPAPPPSTADAAQKKEEKDNGQSQRKTRRCWSPELHRRFLQALQQLGGSHVATPKQIRELMKVDGLTNDEVKSHLQKYRLHTRRPTQTNAAAAAGNSAQTPQFVVVGGIWVPPEYAAMAATGEASGGTSKGVYASTAALPRPVFREASGSPERRRHNSDGAGAGGGGGRSESASESPATSSSTAAAAAAAN
ncbi:transcription factor HHO3-like [Andrographis paniculata]|uniref:transcription factor HHO3-like n=1 Tax=Andrographis paniculata TaxID=175694 RepID=UPI0021E83ABD|nr:transcription factor HHO3-like [Andrographis paniculata]